MVGRRLCAWAFIASALLGCTDGTVELLRVPNGPAPTGRLDTGPREDVEPIRISSIAEAGERIVPYGIVPVDGGYVFAWADDTVTDALVAYAGALNPQGELHSAPVEQGAPADGAGVVVPAPQGAAVGFASASGPIELVTLTPRGETLGRMEVAPGGPFSIAAGQDGYGVVFERAGRSRGEIYSRALAADGSPRTDPVLVGVSDEGGVAPGIAPVGGGYGDVYTWASSPAPGATVVQVLDADGTPAAPAQVITDVEIAFPPVIASHGGGVVVKWSEPGGVGGLRVLDGRGAPTGPPTSAPAPPGVWVPVPRADYSRIERPAVRRLERSPRTSGRADGASLAEPSGGRRRIRRASQPARDLHYLGAC